MAVNYQLELERELQKNEGKTPRLLLHCCCAPCSSYVLEYLSPHFSITAHYYNPNIDTPEEYAHRARELSRFVQEMPLPGAVDVLAEPYTPAEFYAAVKGLEDVPEGGRRCYECYRLRLRRAAQAAAAGGYDYFTTTLSISPHKNAQWLNEIGRRVGGEEGVPFLPSDFKKKGGYAQSIAYSREYQLYRQDYCGCVYSAAAAARRRAQQEAAAPAQKENEENECRG